MASSELGALVDTQLGLLAINTAPEVQNFRVPGERRSNSASPTAGNMATVLGNISTSRGILFTSRKRVRSDSLKLLHEGAL
jgi:hypothetical protein